MSSYFLLCLPGEKGTLTHGSVVDGRFEGFIKTHQGTYYVEPSERYLNKKNVPFHSVIYHEDDIRKYTRTHCGLKYHEENYKRRFLTFYIGFTPIVQVSRYLITFIE